MKQILQMMGIWESPSIAGIEMRNIRIDIFASTFQRIICDICDHGKTGEINN
ncbi:MAG: hypothetical protein SV062_13105 [Thermodesulfobacteriota bacterium]|nr:hypothetical protein [Thermodesulfobacteriota bacterium]